MKKKNIAVIAALVGAALWIGSATLAQRQQRKLADAFPAKLLVSPKSCATPKWPAEARRYEIEGISLLTFRISPEGNVEDAQVVQSSGWEILDSAAIESLVKCQFQPGLEEAEHNDIFPIQFVWTMTGSPPMRPALVEGSCAPSDRFAGFKTFDRSATDATGMLVRLLVEPDGSAKGARAESSGRGEELGRLAEEYVQTCRFAVDPTLRGEQTDTTFGRVIYKPTS
jgi:TonB family protein